MIIPADILFCLSEGCKCVLVFLDNQFRAVIKIVLVVNRADMLVCVPDSPGAIVSQPFLSLGIILHNRKRGLFLRLFFFFRCLLPRQCLDRLFKCLYLQRPCPDIIRIVPMHFLKHFQEVLFFFAALPKQLQIASLFLLLPCGSLLASRRSAFFSLFHIYLLPAGSFSHIFRNRSAFSFCFLHFLPLYM